MEGGEPAAAAPASLQSPAVQASGFPLDLDALEAEEVPASRTPLAPLARRSDEECSSSSDEPEPLEFEPHSKPASTSSTILWHELNWPFGWGKVARKFNIFHLELDELPRTTARTAWWCYLVYKVFVACLASNLLHAAFLQIAQGPGLRILFACIADFGGAAFCTWIFFQGYRGVADNDAARCLRYVSCTLIYSCTWSLISSTISPYFFNGWAAFARDFSNPGVRGFACVLVALESCAWLTCCFLAIYSAYLVYEYRRRFGEGNRVDPRGVTAL
eukprot:tig00021319_g20211.t1